MMSLLSEYSIEIEASETDLYDLIISISKGETRFEEIVEWLKERVR